MQFTGRNLELVGMAVVWAISDVQGQIGSCPDVFTYADDIEELEATKLQLEHLLVRIQKGLAKEAGVPYPTSPT